MFTSRNSNKGFTLVEVVLVIVIIGFLAAVAVPKYQDLTNEAKANACKQSLASLREAINLWRANNIVKNGSSAWPPIDTLRAIGSVVIHQIPPNPFQQRGSAPDSIVTGVTKGVTVGTRGGWAYKATTGQLWANTSSSVKIAGCGSPVSVGESSW